MATRPGSLGAFDANVTYCKTKHLHNVFLKSKSLDGDGMGKLGWMDGIMVRLAPLPGCGGFGA